MKFLLKVAFGIISIALIVASLVLLVTWRSNVKTLTSLAVQDLQEMAFHVMNKIDRFLFYRSVDLAAIANDPIIRKRGATPQELTERLCAFRDIYKTYVSLSFFNLDRVRIADSSGLGIGSKDSAFKSWNEVLQGKVSLATDIGISDTLSIPVIFFARLVHDEEDKPLGVLITRLPMDKLYEIVGAVTDDPVRHKNIKIDLVNRYGLLLYSNYNRKGILLENNFYWESVQRAFAGERKGFTNPHTHPDGVESLSVFCQEPGYLDFPGNGWVLILHAPTNDIFAPIHSLRASWLMVVIPGAIVSVIIALLLSARASRPLTTLRDAAIAIGEGRWETRVSVHTSDELEELASAFNQMAESIQRTTDALTQEKLYSEGIVSSMEDALFVISSEGVIQTVNRATLDLLGYTEDELIGTKVSCVFDTSEALFKEHNLLLAGVTKNLDINFTTKRGEKIPVSFSGSVMRDDKGTPLGIVGVAHDMREIFQLIHELKKSNEQIADFSKTLEKRVNERTQALRRSQEQLEIANRELKEIDKRKTDFVSIVAHELRTPLGTMKEALMQLVDGFYGEVAEGQKEMLSLSLKSILRLTRIINELLDIAKIEAGMFDLRKTRFRFMDVVRDVYKNFDPVARSKKIKLQYESQNEDAEVVADRDSIVQVLTNLLNNSLKFTREGSITIVVSQDDVPNFVRCRVVDTGVGIAAEDLPRVFGKFQQFRSSLVSMERGTGLGLSICKGLVELNGGKIWVESEEGKGSSFIFTLPQSL